MNNKHVCGGAVISTAWVISAAHCFPKPVSKLVRMTTIRAGSTSSYNGGSILQVKEIVVHPSYTPEYDYDVALIKVKKDLIGRNVRPIQLPQVGYDVQPFSKCTVSGWGQLDAGVKETPEILQHTNLTIVETAECHEMLYSHGGVRETWVFFDKIYLI